MNSFRSVIYGLTVIGLVCSLSLTTVSSVTAAEYVSVKSDSVNVRSGPSTNNPVRWEVFQSFPLEVLKREKEWINCLDFEGDQGWIHEDLVVDKPTVIVRKSKINLRTIPSTGSDSKVIALVKYGVVFNVLAKDGEWLKLRHADNTEGWVHRDLVWPIDPLD